MQNLQLLRQIGLKNTKHLLYLYFLKKQLFILKFLDNTPLFASVKLTEACNSKCITCSIDHIEKKPEPSTEQLLAMLTQLHQNGIRLLRFTGGEPLLRRDIHVCLDEAARLGFRKIYIATNGLLLEQKANQLARATNITVSLDGIGKTNDRIRGVAGDFQQSIRGIRRIKEKYPWIDIEIATTLLADNLGDINQLIRLCRELGAKWFANLFDTHLYFFQDVENPHLEAVEPPAIKAALGVIRQAYAETPDTFTFGKKQIDAIEDYLLHGRFPRHCILGFTNVDIGPDGDVYSGCWAMPAMGNLFEQPLTKILGSTAYRQRAKQMLARKCPQCTCGWMINSIYEQL